MSAEEVKSCEETLALTTQRGCEAWREAACALRPSERVRSCLEQLNAVACRSEEIAERCADDILATRCGHDYPSSCSLREVAETGAAVQGCAAYQDAVCQSAVRCGLAKSTEECLRRSEVHCEQALGVREELPSCLGQLAELSCSAWVPPKACLGVVVVLE